MARPGVTREQIFEAAEALMREGKNPTIMAVRSYLGTGSPNTIAPLLAEWRADRETRLVETVPVPPEPVETALRQVWGVACQEAQAQLTTEREALSTARQALEQERTEMLAEIGRLDSEIERVRSKTQQAVEVLETALETERRAHSQTQAEVQAAKALAGERAERVKEERQACLKAEQARNDLRAEVATLTERAAHAKELQEALDRLTQRQYQSHDTDLETRIAEVVDCVRRIADAGGVIDSIALCAAIDRAAEHIPSHSCEKIWTALRGTEGPSMAAEIAQRSETSDGSVRQYCASLAAVEVVKEVSPVSRGPRRYQLIRDTGPRALRIYEHLNAIFDPNTHRILEMHDKEEKS